MPFSAEIAAGRGTFATMVEREGTLSCPHAAVLSMPDAATRDLADAVHALCQLHGSAPSILALAASNDSAGGAAAWLSEADHAFDQERFELARLTAAVGPIPSTPRHAQAEAAINGQRQALATLAGSTRAGCATGAALGLLFDWWAIRPVLAAAAQRSGVVPRPSSLPPRADIIARAQEISRVPSHARALAFGAQQLAFQHHGLWQLLAARAEARTLL